MHHDKYQIVLKNSKIVSIKKDGHSIGHFKEPATKNHLTKIYVVKNGPDIIYVGATTQSMRDRLRGGLGATGEHGYHGYEWKQLSEVDILIWYYPEKGSSEIEALEAELVYLLRHRTGKWPEYQTEIHFHNASADTTRQAEQIFKECYA